MKNLFKAGALAGAVALSCASTNSFAMFAVGAELVDDISGGGCVIGAEEYATNVFTFAGSDTFTQDAHNHGELAAGTVIDRQATITVGGTAIPAACGDVEVDVVITPTALDTTSGGVVRNSVTGPSTTVVQVKDLPNYEIELDVQVTVGSAASSDLVTAFDYKQEWTISVKASNPQTP